MPDIYVSELLSKDIKRQNLIPSARVEACRVLREVGKDLGSLRWPPQQSKDRLAALRASLAECRQTLLAARRYYC